MLVLGALALSPPAATAQGQSVILEVVPNQVDLPMRGGEQAVTVVLRNPTGDTLRDVRLAIGLEAGVSVDPAQFAPAELAPRGELAWVFTVQDANTVLAPGRLRLRVDYMAVPAAQPAGQQNQTPEQPPVPRVMLTAVDVKVRSVETADTLADVQMETTLTTLNEKRPGIVYITTTNKSSIPIAVGKPMVSTDEVIETKVLDRQRQDSLKLAPRGSVVDAIDIRTAEKVRPGKYLVLFKVPIKWDDAWGSQEGQILVKHEVEVSVFGESQILALMAIPTILVLPGTIAMFTALLMLRYLVKPRTDGKRYEPTIKGSTPDFWLFAVTISLVVSLVYPYLTTQLLNRRVDYLESYGYIDIVYLWLGSVFLTAAGLILGFGIWNVSGRAVHLGKKWWAEARIAKSNYEAKQRTITAVDEPLEVIQRLNLNKLGPHLQRVKISPDGPGPEVVAFLLEEWPSTAEKDEREYWIGPPIRLRWNDGADVDLQQQVERELNSDGPMDELFRLLRRARSSQQVSLTWMSVDGLEGPTPIKGPLRRPDDAESSGPLVEMA